MQSRYRAVDWLSLAYGALIVIWLVLRALFFDRFWPLAIVNTSAEYLFLPLPFLLILAAWQRRPVALLSLVVPAVAFAWLLGGLFVPKRPAVSGGVAVTAMSFNVLQHNHDYAAIAAAVQAAAADLVGFQELRPEHAEALSARLGADLPHHTLNPAAEVRGVGLMSRFPILRAERMALPPRDLALRATVDVDGRAVEVFVVHLSPNNLLDFPIRQTPSLAVERYAARSGEVAQLREIIAGLDVPALVLCDCNLTDTSQAYTALDAVLDDSFREAGWGLGHTGVANAIYPLQRIDYVWHSAGFTAVHAYVGRPGGSDHLPVVARLLLEASQER